MTVTGTGQIWAIELTPTGSMAYKILTALASTRCAHALSGQTHRALLVSRTP